MTVEHDTVPSAVEVNLHGVPKPSLALRAGDEIKYGGTVFGRVVWVRGREFAVAHLPRTFSVEPR